MLMVYEVKFYVRIVFKAPNMSLVYLTRGTPEGPKSEDQTRVNQIFINITKSRGINSKSKFKSLFRNDEIQTLIPTVNVFFSVAFNLRSDINDN